MKESLQRPRPLTALISLMLFLGVTAIAGGAAMTFGLGGDRVMVPTEWLADIPLVDSWVIPGLVLGIGFGIGSLLVAYGLLRRPGIAAARPLERLTGDRHWSWAGALAIGIGHLVWIGLEFLWLPGVSILMVAYGSLAAAIVAFAMAPSVRTDLALGT